jgi:nucleotide-binding universal stress UspA family protein
MYKHISSPTDGSERSEEAVMSGILFARDVGAAGAKARVP